MDSYHAACWLAGKGRQQPVSTGKRARAGRTLGDRLIWQADTQNKQGRALNRGSGGQGVVSNKEERNNVSEAGKGMLTPRQTPHTDGGAAWCGWRWVSC